MVGTSVGVAKGIKGGLPASPFIIFSLFGTSSLHAPVVCFLPDPRPRALSCCMSGKAHDCGLTGCIVLIYPCRLPRLVAVVLSCGMLMRSSNQVRLMLSCWVDSRRAHFFWHRTPGIMGVCQAPSRCISSSVRVTDMSPGIPTQDRTCHECPEMRRIGERTTIATLHAVCTDCGQQIYFVGHTVRCTSHMRWERDSSTHRCLSPLTVRCHRTRRRRVPRPYARADAANSNLRVHFISLRTI